MTNLWWWMPVMSCVNIPSLFGNGGFEGWTILCKCDLVFAASRNPEMLSTQLKLDLPGAV